MNLEKQVSEWQQLARISGFQEEIVANWTRMLFAGLEPRAFLQLAPQWLHQTINPWSFSLMNFVKETKGDAATETEIVTRVASYGSQLGTIIDALQVLADGKQQDLLVAHAQATTPEKKAALMDDWYQLESLRRLAEKIDRAKK